MRRLVKRERARLDGERLKLLAALAALGREKAFEGEAIGGKPARAQNREQRRRPGDRNDRGASPDSRLDQPKAGIGERRRSGVGDERDVFPALELFRELRGLLALDLV